jgi:hypothetical protein
LSGIEGLECAAIWEPHHLRSPEADRDSHIKPVQIDPEDAKRIDEIVLAIATRIVPACRASPPWRSRKKSSSGRISTEWA